MKTSVYRYYDKHGRLIYAGITNRGAKRNREHNESKDWWRWVARQEVSHCDSRAEAENLERELIQTYHPPFNTQHNRGWQEIREAYEDEMNCPTAEEQRAWCSGSDSGYTRGWDKAADLFGSRDWRTRDLECVVDGGDTSWRDGWMADWLTHIKQPSPTPDMAAEVAW